MTILKKVLDNKEASPLGYSLSKLRCEPKIANTSTYALVLTLEDARESKADVFLAKKELPSKPIYSTFSYID